MAEVVDVEDLVAGYSNWGVMVGLIEGRWGVTAKQKLFKGQKVYLDERTINRLKQLWHRIPSSVQSNLKDGQNGEQYLIWLLE